MIFWGDFQREFAMSTSNDTKNILRTDAEEDIRAYRKTGEGGEDLESCDKLQDHLLYALSSVLKRHRLLPKLVANEVVAKWSPTVCDVDNFE